MKNFDIDLLNKHFPDNQFKLDEFNDVYVSGRKHHFAHIGSTSYFNLRTLPPFIKKSIHNKNIFHLTNKIVSCYFFYHYIIFNSEKKVINKVLNKISSSNMNGTYLMNWYHLKESDDFNIICVPDFHIGSYDICLHLTNYSENPNDLNFYINNQKIQDQNSVIVLDSTINEELFFKLLNKFFYDSMFKKYLGIEIEEFTIDHIPLLKMMTC